MEKFNEIDYENWNRREIFELFSGYTYTMSTEVDITGIRACMKREGKKFYPIICWCATKTANEDPDFRMEKLDGKIGYFERLNTSYTLRRKADPTLFTHMVTEYDPNFEVYYGRFLEDQKRAEAENRLYYYGKPLMDSLDLSIIPTVAFSAVSLNIPESFYYRDEKNQRYTPFTCFGRFHEREGKTVLPLFTNFHHAVNDGYHAEKYFHALQANLDLFS